MLEIPAPTRECGTPARNRILAARVPGERSNSELPPHWNNGRAVRIPRGRPGFRSRFFWFASTLHRCDENPQAANCPGSIRYIHYSWNADPIHPWVKSNGFPFPLTDRFLTPISHSINAYPLPECVNSFEKRVNRRILLRACVLRR